MRNIRARRRAKALLAIFLIISVIAFFESRIEAFAPQFKTMAEAAASDALGKRFSVSIGAINGGIVRPFMLHDVKVMRKGAEGGRTALVATGDIKSSYRIWGLILPALKPSKPYVAVNFSTKNGELSGFAIFEGSRKDASVDGFIRFFGREKVFMSGRLTNGAADVLLMPKEGLVKINGNFAAEGVVILKAVASHFKFNTLDITGEATVKSIVSDGIEGGLEAKNIVLNYRPFDDVKGSFRILKDVFEVSDLDIGKICRINGALSLKKPHVLNAVAVTDNVSLDQTLAIFNPHYASVVQGTMNSRWEFKGPLDSLKSSIRLDIRKGRILEMKFESLSARLNGDGAIISIEDSRIARESGSFTLAGYMDLARIGKDSFFENLKVTGGDSAVLWDAYDTAKWQDVREFRMKKKVVDGLDVGFRQLVDDRNIDESLKDRDEYELSYNLHDKDSLKLKVSDNKNFFGLEHKDKF